MKDVHRQWLIARDDLVSAVVQLGFEVSLGNEIARQLGSPKAMERMTAYLRYEKPKKVEIMIDEMLAIRSEIEAWREKKESEEASARYYNMRREGFSCQDEEMD